MAKKDPKVNKKPNGLLNKAAGWLSSAKKLLKRPWKDGKSPTEEVKAKAPALVVTPSLPQQAVKLPDAVITAVPVPPMATLPASVIAIPAPVIPLSALEVKLPPPAIKCPSPELKCSIDEISGVVLRQIWIPDGILQSGKLLIRNVNSSEEDFQRITRYFENGKYYLCDARIKSIMRITRTSELGPRPLGLEGGPRKMLFHGTRGSNVGSILSDGFLPTKSRCGGGMFFADRAEKSFGYSSDGWLFLCEVFLGKSSPWGTGLPSGFDSFLIRGGLVPDEKGNVTISDCVWPMGKTIVQGYSYNEYIVYRAEQVRLRYLIQWEKTPSA